MYWTDIDITETSKKQAHIAAGQIKNEHIDIAFTSKLARAQHSLQIIQEVCGWQDIPIIMDKAFNERDYGDLEGLNRTEAARKFGEEQVNIWRKSYDIAPPGGESLKDTYERTVGYFISIVLPQLQKGRNILIVAHSGSLRAIIMYLECLSPSEILQREIGECVPVKYEMGKFYPQKPLHFSKA